MVESHVRRANRYEITAPVSYWWSLRKGPMHSGHGEMRNISHSGVLVATTECPPLGTVVEMSVVLPRVRGNGNGMKLHGEGIVLRLQDVSAPTESGLTKGFAASVHFYPELPDAPEDQQLSRIENLKKTVQ